MAQGAGDDCVETMVRRKQRKADLFREELEACRVTLGGRHPDTLISIDNLAALLQAKGDLEGAEPLLQEAREARRP